ncbi:hypothetical protein [Streptomyces bangladeshensis]|uniref:Uncharacterized protein n=1 Tax=Streptomyces bangladeshensis TaxID=295352 RepID=A0ABN3BSK2_9ACTN
MAVNGLSDAKVGDHLILVTGSKYRSDEPVTVSRVGRKYLYVNLHGREYRARFLRDSGLEDSTYGAQERLYTPEQYDEMKQRKALFLSLREAGIEVQWKVRDDLTTDQLRALLAVIKPAT